MADAERKAPDPVIDAVTAAGFYRLLSPRQSAATEPGPHRPRNQRVAGPGRWFCRVGSSAWGRRCVDGVTLLRPRAIGGVRRQWRRTRAGAATGSRPPRGRERLGERQLGLCLRMSARYVGRDCCDRLTDNSGRASDAYWCLVPPQTYAVEHLADNGMRGTGSNTWVGEDVFVPDYRTIPMDDVREGGAYPRPTDAPMYRLPFANSRALSRLGPHPWDHRRGADLHHREGADKGDAPHDLHQAERVGWRPGPDRRGGPEARDRPPAYIRNRRSSWIGPPPTTDTLTTTNARKPAPRAVSRPSRCSTRSTSWSTCTARVASPNPTRCNGIGATPTRLRDMRVSPVVGYEVFGKSLLGVDEHISPMV